LQLKIINLLEKAVSQVKYAENDAKAFKALLKDDLHVPEENITYWVEQNATKTALEQELPYFIKQLTKKDQFIFYYAGHGFYNVDSNRLTVWDSHINNLYGTTVSLKEILTKPLLKSACNKKLLFLDACSTLLTDSLLSRDLISSMNLNEFKDFADIKSFYALFCSCSPGEKSFPSEKLKHGIWTWHLIEALKGKVPAAIFNDVFITDTSLQNYLSKSVPEFITKETLIKTTQKPFAEVSSSNTFIIRELPPSIVNENELPKLILKFDKMELRKIQTTNYQRLSGYKSSHFPPSLGHSGNIFIQSISIKEIQDEIQEIYERTKDILGLKRKEIEKSINKGGGSIANEYFRYFVSIIQHPNDPLVALITRTLIIRVPRNKLPEKFDEMFPVSINEIVIPIEGEADFDDLVDKFENLKETMGGSLKEDDTTGIITYTTDEDIIISIHTEDMEIIIRPKAHLHCLKLIDYATQALNKVTGQSLKLLQ